MTTIDKFTYPWPTPLTESWPVFFDNHLATHHDVWRGPLGIEGLRSLYRTPAAAATRPWGIWRCCCRRRPTST